MSSDSKEYRNREVWNDNGSKVKNTENMLSSERLNTFEACSRADVLSMVCKSYSFFRIKQNIP